MTAPGVLPGGRPHGVRAPTRTRVVSLARRHPALNGRGTFSRHHDSWQSTDLEAFFFIQKVQFVFNSSEQGQSFKLLDGWPFICKAFLFFKPWCKDQARAALEQAHCLPYVQSKAPGFSTKLHKLLQDHESKEDGPRLGGTSRSHQAPVPTTGMPRNRRCQESVIKLRCLKSKNKPPRP